MTEEYTYTQLMDLPDEDEVIWRLKGLTETEAHELCDHLHRLGMDSPDTITIGDVSQFIDDRLRPYGWSLKSLGRFV